MAAAAETATPVETKQDPLPVKPPSNCIVCGKPDAKSCEKCRCISYCSTECAESHHEKHQKFCADKARHWQLPGARTNYEMALNMIAGAQLLPDSCKTIIRSKLGADCKSLIVFTYAGSTLLDTVNAGIQMGIVLHCLEKSPHNASYINMENRPVSIKDFTMAAAVYPRSKGVEEGVILEEALKWPDKVLIVVISKVRGTGCQFSKSNCWVE